MKVALASRTKLLLSHLLAEHKAMWFLSVQPACLQHLMEQNVSSPGKGSCASEREFFTSLLPLSSSFRDLMMTMTMLTILNRTQNGNVMAKTMHVLLQIPYTSLDSGMQKRALKGTMLQLHVNHGSLRPCRSTLNLMGTPARGCGTGRQKACFENTFP